MAEHCLLSSNEIPSTLPLVKETNSLDTIDANSVIAHSSSKDHSRSNETLSLSSSSSTTSLTIYCIETGSIAQSIRRRQSITNTVTTLSSNMETPTTPTGEGHLLNDNNNNKTEELVTDFEKIFTATDTDNESLEDDNDTIIDDSLYQPSFPTPPNYVSSPCPICFEQAVLQVSPCCYFLCCNSCWRAHISSTINDGRIKIPCVSNECNKYLTRESIVNFVRYDFALHERYLKLYLNANQNPRTKTCPRCCHLYSLDSIKPIVIGNNKKLKKDNKKIPKQVQCSECSLVWCFRCSAPWHENLTCKQFKKGDKLLFKWINQKNDEQWNARKCPKCSSLIQRAGGCPHMTCQSCSCEFCYLCGRRYVQIPLIGQHSNKLSMFGCPYNFYPEKPWLRRTIRGVIASTVIAASPILVVGAATAAIAVLPPLGLYKLIKRVRSRNQRDMVLDFPVGEPFLIEHDIDDPRALAHAAFHFDLNDELIRDIRQSLVRIALEETIDENTREEQNTNQIINDFPLFIFSQMDVEHLFSDKNNPSDDEEIDDKTESNQSPSDFRTCPTTPATTIRKNQSRSLTSLTKTSQSSIDCQHSTVSEY